MEKEAQKPLAPPRINDIDKVLRELGIGPGMPNQGNLTTPKVSLTEERYFPSEAMAKVKNIATLMDATMDKDFLEHCQNAKMYSFYISPKDIPEELIDTLENLGAGDHEVYFKIDHEKKTLNPISKSQYGRLSPNERGRLHRSVLEGIRKGGLLYTNFSDPALWVTDPAYFGNRLLRKVAFTEPTD